MQTIVSLHTYVYDCFSIYTYIYTIHFNYLNSRTHQHYVDFLKCYFQVRQALGDKDMDLARLLGGFLWNPFQDLHLLLLKHFEPLSLFLSPLHGIVYVLCLCLEFLGFRHM